MIILIQVIIRHMSSIMGGGIEGFLTSSRREHPHKPGASVKFFGVPFQKGTWPNRQHERKHSISYLFIKQFLRFFGNLLVWI